MATIKFANGKSVRFDGTPTEQDIEDVAQQIGISEEKKPITEGLFGTHAGENSKILAASRIPSQFMNELSNKEMDLTEPQTQSTLLNAAIRTPQTIKSIGSKLVASAITPESAIMQGALRAAPLLAKPINAVGRMIGQGAEKLSGLGYKTPGILGEVVENPSLPFKPGVESANEVFAAKVDPGQVRESFKTILGKKELVEGAIDAVKDGTITADEALAARQALDQIKNQVPRSTFFNIRQTLDAVAKTKFAGADEAYVAGIKSDALGNIFPMNKGGTPSRLGQLVQGGAMLGTHFNPAAPAVAAAVSPYVQGRIASGIGVAKQGIAEMLNNPAASGVGLANLIEEIRTHGKRK